MHVNDTNDLGKHGTNWYTLVQFIFIFECLVCVSGYMYICIYMNVFLSYKLSGKHGQKQQRQPSKQHTSNLQFILESSTNSSNGISFSSFSHIQLALNEVAAIVVVGIACV